MTGGSGEEMITRMKMMAKDERMKRTRRKTNKAVMFVVRVEDPAVVARR